MCWVLSRVCAWMILLILLFNRKAVEWARIWKLESLVLFLALPLTDPVVLGHATFLLCLMSSSVKQGAGGLLELNVKIFSGFIRHYNLS